MDIVFFSASLFFLFIATLHYLLFLVYRSPVVPRVARFALYLTLASQLGFLLSRFIKGGMPFGTNMYESLVFFSWCLVTAYLLLTMKFKVPVVGAFVMPITLILTAAAALMPEKGISEIPPALQSNWLPIHVTLCFMGDALFAMALAALSLVQNGIQLLFEKAVVDPCGSDARGRPGAQQKRR